MMKGAVLCFVLGAIVVKSTLKDCYCNYFINKHGYGQCTIGHSRFFNGAVLCYVTTPSGCSDILESTTDRGKWTSAEACKNISKNGPSISPHKHDAGCICSHFINTNSFGQCKKGDSSVFDGQVFCYVKIPSGCADLVKSTTAPGKWLSAQACTTNKISHQLREDCIADIKLQEECTCSGDICEPNHICVEGKLCIPEEANFYNLDLDGQLECNETVDCPPITSGPFICSSEKKDGEELYTCSAQVFQYKCQLKDSVCTDSFCTKKCFSSQEYQPREMIDGREYGCIQGCEDPRINNCDEYEDVEMCPWTSGGVVTKDVSATAVQSVSKPSKSTRRCPHGTCRRHNICCLLQYHPRRRFYICPHSCPV